MAARVLHVSDLHIGDDATPETLEELHRLVEGSPPDLVVATGDLAHRARPAELERARDLLLDLGHPLLVVPGNHDIPWSPSRLTRPFARWERAFGGTEPVFRSETLVAVGLNSVRPWRHQGGAVAKAQLDRVADELRSAPPRALRLVALHHHLASPPWRAARKRPVSDRGRVLRALADAGAELIVSGHVHQAAVAERREFEVLDAARCGPLVLASTSGLGRPRSRRVEEARGVNVYEADDSSLAVTTYAWNGGAFVETGRRGFGRA